MGDNNLKHGLPPVRKMARIVVSPKHSERMKASQLLMTEEQLGENVRDACEKLGWRFLWLRKTYNSSAGILDLTLVPVRLRRTRLVTEGHRHTLHRELKGYDARGRLGKATEEQVETIKAINLAGGDAAIWRPEDWLSGKILEELR